MAILAACLIFLSIAILVSVAGLRLWVRPKEAMERVTGSAGEYHEAIPLHPSLVFHDLVKRLGSIIPASPKDVTVMQRRLIRAGYRGPMRSRPYTGPRRSSGFWCPS